MQHFNQQREQSESSTLCSPENQQKINLINRNLPSFKRHIKKSLTIASIRIICFLIIIYNDKIFIGTQIKTDYSDSWSIILYIIASLMDLLIVMNDVQLLRFLRRERPYLDTVKKQLNDNAETISNTMAGSYRNYLSIYDMIKTFRYHGKFFTSICQTIRHLEFFIVFHSFGNIALNSQLVNQTKAVPTIILWVYLISIYLSVFQLDLAGAEGSSGPYVEPKVVNTKAQQSQPFQFGQIKKNYIKRIRRPFEIVSLLNIILLLIALIFFLEFSLFTLMTILCIMTHMAELIYQKYIQNKLMVTNLGVVAKKYLTSYQILKEITKETKIIHLLVTTGNRFAIGLMIMACFRDYKVLENNTVLYVYLVQSFLFLGQYLKFYRADNGKLYFLRPKCIDYNPLSIIQCSICLLNCQKNDKVIELPCFSNHVYHLSCMQKWLKERKECPLCRQSLEIYQLRI